MKSTRNSTVNWVLPSLLLAALLAVGCTKYPSEEELRLLDEQMRAADAAEQRVTELEQEKARLEAELQQQKKVLADHEAEFEEIKRRMPR